MSYSSVALWARSTKNPDKSTKPLACLFTHLLTLLTRLLARSLRWLPNLLESEWLDGYFSVFFFLFWTMMCCLLSFPVPCSCCSQKHVRNARTPSPTWNARTQTQKINALKTTPRGKEGHWTLDMDQTPDTGDWPWKSPMVSMMALFRCAVASL